MNVRLYKVRYNNNNVFQQKKASPEGIDFKYMEKFVQFLIKWCFVYFFNPVFVQFVFKGVDRICFNYFRFQFILILCNSVGEGVLIRDNFLEYFLYILCLCPRVTRCDISKRSRFY